MTQVPQCELTNTNRRNVLAIAGALLASAGIAGYANAQAAPQATAPGAGSLKVPTEVFEGSIRRAQKYLADKQAFAQYQEHLKKMLDGFKAGQDPEPLIREAVLSEPEARTKLAAFTKVAGTEGVFHICMLTVLATLATEQRSA